MEGPNGSGSKSFTTNHQRCSGNREAEEPNEQQPEWARPDDDKIEKDDDDDDDNNGVQTRDTECGPPTRSAQ